MASPNVNGKYITQQISHDNNIIRDSYILKNICKVMNKYDKVVLFIGKNHLYAHFEVLIDIFNKKYKFIK